MSKKDDTYIPALRYRWLTQLYDPIVAITSREKLFKKKLLRLVTNTQALHLLDLACGTGTLSRMIKLANPEMNVYGLDADPGILELARHKSLHDAQAIQFDQGMSFAMPYPDHAFDVVVSSLFFHHLNTNNKQYTLTEIRRVLKAGGRFFVCDWGKPTNLLLRLSFYLVQVLDGFDVTRDNVQGHLPDLIATAGFDQVEVVEHIATMLGTLDLITATST